MRFKIDENLPSSLCILLEENLLESETVHDEGLSGNPDEMIVAECKREGLVLITMDIGFANQSAYPAGTHPGMIVIRVRNQSTKSVISVMKRFLGKQVDLEDFAGCTVIVEENRYRVRRGLREV
ncbi:MAG: hypothetical protein C4536_01235 [Actinobacteria bacterium]|nr:MAG: hypothetical protein C4536_01235 [Actinomycetota bacterium]